MPHHVQNMFCLLFLSNNLSLKGATLSDVGTKSTLLQCNFETHAKSEIHIVIRLQAAVDIYTFTHMLAPRSLFDDAQFLSQESKKQRPTVDLSVSQLVYTKVCIVALPRQQRAWHRAAQGHRIKKYSDAYQKNIDV